MIKNKYKSDYQASPRMDARGRIRADYYYTGDYYCLPLDEAAKKKAGTGNLLFGFGMLALIVTAGLLNADSSRIAWITFPYIFLFLPCAYLLFGAFSFLSAGVRMTKPVYDGSLVRMQKSCWGVIILTGINLILDIVFMILNHAEIHMGKEGLFSVLMAGLLLLGILFGRYYDRTYMPVTVERAS